MDLDTTHPTIADLRATARRRMPRFAWEYLESGTGSDRALGRNAEALDRVTLLPDILCGPRAPDLSVRLLGRTHPLPFGISPVGMSSLMWPGAEVALARLAAREGIPYGLSNVAAETPEVVGPEAGEDGWFQLYPPGDAEIRRDIVARARDAGFRALVLTADVAVASRRERQRRARLTNPMKMTPRVIFEAALRPQWSLATLSRGIPRLKTLEKYADTSVSRPGTAHIGYLLRTAPDWKYLAALRKEWSGPLLVKGVLQPDAAKRLADEGVDALWVSNHGGRQFDAAPAALDMLGAVKDAAPGLPVIYDGGIRSGTDILRAMAMGADFVMLARAFHYGMAAFGPRGAAHVVHVLRESLLADMGQLGLDRLADVPGRLLPERPAAG